MSDLEERLAWILYADGLPPFEQEHRFHPVRRWRFDFANLEYKVAIECEGGIWVEGRHTRGRGFEKDCTKYNEAAVIGWLVLRVTSKHIDSGKALVWARMALAERGWRDGGG